MIGCIDVGGGLRDIYGAGVFDYLLDEGISFDLCIGVSAGSANCVSFIAGQKGRNKKFYTEYILRKEAMSPLNLIRTRSLLDLTYVYGELSNENGEYPLDYDALQSNKTEFIVVATEAESGKPVYFNKKDDIHRNDYRTIMASSCLPIISKPIEINSTLYFDGGLSDPLPVDKALEMGCDKIVVILTMPIEAQFSTTRNDVAAKIIKNKYPNMVKGLNSQYEKYAQNLVRVLELQEEGKALIVAPDNVLGMKTLTRDIEKLAALYSKGYEDAKKIKEFVKN